MSLLHGLLVLSLYLIATNGLKYEIEFRDNPICMPCEDQPGIFLDKVFDKSKLNVEHLDDGSLQIFGTVEFIYNLKPDTKLQLTLQLYKKSRNNWVNTIYNIKRADACRACFDPTELWHKFFERIPIAERVCPFYKGQIFHFNVTTKPYLIVPDRHMEGEYKTTAMLTIDDDVPIMCVNVFASAYRV